MLTCFSVTIVRIQHSTYVGVDCHIAIIRKFKITLEVDIYIYIYIYIYIIHSPENATGNPQFWPVLIGKNTAKMWKMSRLCPKSNQFWKWSGYISKSSFRPCILQRMPGNAKFDLFYKVSLACVTLNFDTWSWKWSMLFHLTRLMLWI